MPTRMRPKRMAELIGGSLHWIVKHRIVARQVILRFDDRSDGRIDIVCAGELLACTPRAQARPPGLALSRRRRRAGRGRRRGRHGHAAAAHVCQAGGAGAGLARHRRQPVTTAEPLTLRSHAALAVERDGRGAAGVELGAVADGGAERRRAERAQRRRPWRPAPRRRSARGRRAWRSSCLAAARDARRSRALREDAAAGRPRPSPMLAAPDPNDDSVEVEPARPGRWPGCPGRSACACSRSCVPTLIVTGPASSPGEPPHAERSVRMISVRPSTRSDTRSSARWLPVARAKGATSVASVTATARRPGSRSKSVTE